jgi:hypothetical protein
LRGEEVVIMRLTKRIANPGGDCRTGRGNAKYEIRNAKKEPQGLCGTTLGWAILWGTLK